MKRIVKFLKKTGKAIAVAFSIYSIIPMPRFVWASEDMDYHLIFFPWVGAVIGGLEWLWMWIRQTAGMGTPAYAAVAVCIPLLVTGGFHLDGYLDTMDAIHSYQPRERRLEIMSDPHIGAFAVVWAGIWFLLFYAGAAELAPGREFAAWCLSFFLTRCLSGLGVVSLPSAKKEGMLQTFSTTASKGVVRCVLILETCLVCLLILFFGAVTGAVEILCAAACYVLYWRLSLRHFGGITGDLAGCFVCVTELLCTLAAAIS